MPKGARKGRQARLGAKLVPDSVRQRREEQDAFIDSQARVNARVRRGNREKQAEEAARYAPETDDPFATYDIEPVLGKYPHVDMAEGYVRQVLDGTVPACLYVKQACERWNRLMARDDIVFNPYEAQRACNFIQSMPHVKGTWKTKCIRLEPWQAFIVCSVFGFYWAHDLSLRVVRMVYIEVPRKNAKSTLSAAIGLYMLTEVGEEGPEVYSAATTHKQALAIFNPATAMARRHRAFAEAHDIVVQANEIKLWGTLGMFSALHAQGETLDGLNIHCSLVDELHAHKTRAVYDVLETAMGSRRNPLMFNITTAGVNRAGICFEIRDYTKRLLSGTLDEPSAFGIIYTIDDEDVDKKNFFDPAVWRKANPNLNVSISETELKRLAAKARATSSALNNFLTKHLDVWVNAAVGWLSMEKWGQCADFELTEDDFEGADCILALDLASKIDVNAKVKVFRKEIDGVDHYYCFPKFYLPEARIEEEENDAYPGWVTDGYLHTTPGNVIDMDLIEEDIVVDAGRHVLKEIPYDPYQATQLAVHMAKEGFTMVEVRPTVLNFSAAMKEVEQLVMCGRFHHDGNPVMTWMMSNVVVKRDQKDNIYPRKEFPENKIDGPVALFMAMCRWLAATGDGGESVYETRGVIQL